MPHRLNLAHLNVARKACIKITRLPAGTFDQLCVVLFGFGVWHCGAKALTGRDLNFSKVGA
jgi:hypothetical protein